ncbi:MAG TPA: hypothetical protein PKC30_11000 [Saprospiraceae bacterium]|nr:hypothetical protein [Saprospiraceae bacterium]
MKKDRLEQFIIENRHEMQVHRAPDHIWQNLAKELDKSEKSSHGKSPFFYFISGIAASITLVITAIFGYHVVQINTNKVYKEEIAMMRDFQQKENDYVKMVNNKLTTLKGSNIDQSLEYDLLQLDAIYQELKAELLSSQSDNLEAIISALINHYETKLEILKTLEDKQSESLNTTENENLNI